MKYIVLDTNILLLNAQNLISIADKGTIIVLPETVMDEMDAKKSGYSELAYQAREFGRLLTKAKNTGVKTDDAGVVTTLQLDDTMILVVSLNNYDLPSNLDSKVINDRKIIEVARYIHKKYQHVTFMSNDVMCRLRAEAFGLTVTDFKEVSKVKFEFTKTLQVETEVFKTLHGTEILSVDPEYLIENYNYMFEDMETEQIKLATISKGSIVILGKETEKELRRQDVNPKNAAQLFLSKAIQDDGVDIVVCEALSGSGKSIISISNAISLVKQRKYESIIYFRAAIDDVDDVEAVGFLPGLETKFEVYLHPLEDSLDFIARNRHKDSKLKGEEFETKIKEVIEEIREKCHIQAMTGLGMRGRTFDNCVFLIDEAQGQSPASLQKVLTRIGKNCKVIIIGSNNQIDNKYMTKFTNGLSKVLNACSNPAEGVVMHAVTLDRVERGHIAAWAEALFSKEA